MQPTQLSKKEIKMYRNRISAQRSRDRKKKEMDDLKMISKNLLDENNYLKKELEIRDRELFEMREKLSKLCSNCVQAVNASSVNNYTTNNLFNSKKLSLVDLSRRTFTNNMKYSLMAGFLVVFFIIGTLSGVLI